MPLFFLSSNFTNTSFGGETFFIEASFKGKAVFSEASFERGALFIGASFEGNTDFSIASFKGAAVFTGVSFEGESVFKQASFEEWSYFNRASFERGTDFSRARFKYNVDFREIIVSEELIFDNSNWQKRIDLRGMSATTFQWDSTNYSSNVGGVVDLREAWIGSATFKEIRFQDLVDFSRTIFGQYREKIFGPPTKEQWEKERGYLRLLESKVYAWVKVPHNNPLIHFENNTFEKEADFLHITTDAPSVFINNRFRSTLDLTGATFVKQSYTTPLCLSYNRINRLVFESKHLSNVRRIDVPACQVNVASNNPAVVAEQTAEPLPSIYKTLEKAFKDANDQLGANEAWYLYTVAKRDEKAEVKDWFDWLIRDVPSRYSVDIWRPVSLSITIIVVFSIAYLFYFLLFDFVIEFWHLIRGKEYQHDQWVSSVDIPESSDRHRAIRFRPFEDIHSKHTKQEREIYPFHDAVSLSIRAFTKIGQGAIYPDTRLLKGLTWLEWWLGAFMLVHFLLAIRSNLPFILPFLGLGN